MSNIYFKVLKHHQDAIQRLYGARWVPQPYHFKMCKTLMESQVEGFDPYTPEEIIARLDAYYGVDFWQTTRHDFANFCKHFDKFLPEKKVESHRRPQPQTMSMVIYCTRCETNHRADQACPVKVA